MATLTYSQLEGAWIKAGGSSSLAPLMAAIALAESGGRTDALNPTDNGGRQSSFGLWQISTGTHTPPASNWQDPVVNARLAVGKYKTQGLSAWGTYTSGAYKRFLANGVPPSSNVGSGGALADGGTISAIPVAGPVASDVDPTCAWHVKLPLIGETCMAHKTQVRAGLAVLVIGMGAAVTLIGGVLLVVYGLKRTEGRELLSALRLVK